MLLLVTSGSSLHFGRLSHLGHIKLIPGSLHGFIQIWDLNAYLSPLNFVILGWEYLLSLFFWIMLFLCFGRCMIHNSDSFLFIDSNLKLLVFKHLFHLLRHCFFVFSMLTRCCYGNFEIFLFLLRCFLRLRRRFCDTLNSSRSDSIQYLSSFFFIHWKRLTILRWKNYWRHLIASGWDYFRVSIHY